MISIYISLSVDADRFRSFVIVASAPAHFNPFLLPCAGDCIAVGIGVRRFFMQKIEYMWHVIHITKGLMRRIWNFLLRRRSPVDYITSDNTPSVRIYPIGRKIRSH